MQSASIDSRVVAPAIRSRAWAVAAAATLAGLIALFVYLVDARVHLDGQSGDTDSNQLLPLTVLVAGDFDFDEFFDPGAPLPYAFRSTNGHIVSSYPVGPGLLNSATFLAAHLGGSSWQSLYSNRTYYSLVTGAICTALAVGLTVPLLAALGWELSWSLAGALALAFGTTALSVAARGIWQHGPALLFLVTGLLLAQRRSMALRWLCGLAFGAAIACRPPILVLAAPLLLLLLVEHGRTALALLAGLAIPALLVRWYAWHYFGSPFANADYPAAQGSGLGADPLEGLLGVLVSPGRGLLVYSPFMVLAVPGAVAAVRGRDARGIALAIGVVLYLGLIGVWKSWWGGASYGYRMATEVVPFLFPLIAAGRAVWWPAANRGVRAFAVALVTLSVFVHFVGARYYPRLPYPGFEQSRADAWSWSPERNELVACSLGFADSVRQHFGLD